MEELAITVNIANRKYKLTIDAIEEENVRKAAATIDSKVKDFATKYAHKDVQDLLAMIVLQYTTKAISLENKIDFRENELVEKLEKINTVLDEHI